MTKPPPIVDLRDEAPAHVRGAAFAQARRLARGGVLTLLVAQEPSLLMHSVNLQLHGSLVWTIREKDDAWQVEVRHRSDTPAQDLLDLLAREHESLNAMMAALLRLANDPDAGGLDRACAAFAQRLRRHVSFENGELAPLCVASEPRTPDAPTAIMLREHDEILRQLAALEDGIAGGDRGEIGAFAAILSGTLAKHEHREESALFPRWRAALAALAPESLASLFARAAAGSAR